jgi:hypothetical protein
MRDENPRRVLERQFVYLRMTRLSPEERFANHKARYMAHSAASTFIAPSNLVQSS